MAEVKIIGLNQGDKERVQGLLDDAAERLGNLPYRDRPAWEPNDTTEVYIAKAPNAIDEPPSGGIPALTVRPGDFDRPGFAKCRIWRVSPGSTGIPELHPIEDKKLRVYNLTTTVIAANTWISVQRSKSGAWIAQIGGVASVAPREPPDIALVTQARIGVYHVAFRLADFDPDRNPPRFLYNRVRDRILVLNLADAVAEEGGI